MTLAHHAVRAERWRGLAPEDLLHFRWLQDVGLSPDADYLAYTVKQVDAETNGYNTHLFVREASSACVQRLTTGRGSASSVAWSRRGARLAYLWSDDCGHAIRVWNATTGEEDVYTLQGPSLSELDWDPDGRRLVGVRWTPWRRADERSPAPGVPAPSVRLVRRLRYKQDGEGWVHDRYRQIWILDLESGEFLQLTSSECDCGQPRWSWNGQGLAFTATSREQNVRGGYGQIMIHDFEQGLTRPLMYDWTGAALSPQWRADDGAIAFAGNLGPAPVNRRLFYHVWLCDLPGMERKNLTQDLGQTVGNYAVADQRAGLTNITIKWPGGEGPIYFLLTEEGATHLYSVIPDQSPERRVGGDCVVFDYAPSRGGTVAYGQADARNPGELYVLRDGRTTCVTALNTWLAERRLAPPESYRYEGLDGVAVHAWIMKPPHFQANERYPAIVYVHCSMFSWDFNHEFQCLANAGYIVAYFNQRGTTAGYGQAHALGNYYGKHEQEFEEIMLGVDDLVQRPYVDKQRLGVTGGSCGGFMTNWIVGHSDRFAAAVTQRSISDLVSKFGTSDNGPEQAESEGGGRPWQDIQLLWRSSPLAYAAQIHTPLLIIHSDADHRCALGQAEELFAALRWLGHDVELVIFEGESHGLSSAGRPGNRIERLRRILNWFNRYLNTVHSGQIS